MPTVQLYPQAATLTGGLRSRMIKDSYRNLIVDNLTSLGWFDSGRRHIPITIADRPNKWDDPVAFNTLTVSLEDRVDVDAEMGSNLSIDTWTSYVDFYAESDDLGLQVMGDIRDIVRGKLPSIGRTQPCFDCFDYRLDPPEAFTVIQVQNILEDRARNFPKEWQAHWFVLRADLEDEYMDESG